jgi:hypothetical protein
MIVVQLTIAEIDLGPCRARTYVRGNSRWAVILPGANYGPDAPLLWFAREALASAGYDVLAVLDSFDRTADPLRWVADRTDAALRHVADARPMLLGKSLTTLAAKAAAERSLAAIWLTPLLARGHPAAEVVVAGLTSSAAPCLLVGGAADEAWDGEVARSIPSATVIEIPDADHALQVPGDLVRTLDALREVTTAIAAFASQ